MDRLYEHKYDFATQVYMEKAITSGGLAIKEAESPTAKTVSAVKYFDGGALRSISGADMPALVGTVTADKFNVFVFFADKTTGTVEVAMGTEGDTLAEVVFPTVDQTDIVLGWIEINPTGTGDFVGGTTDLDDATVVPNAVYVDSFLKPYPIECYNTDTFNTA